jgi:hypothetical protein
VAVPFGTHDAPHYEGAFVHTIDASVSAHLISFSINADMRLSVYWQSGGPFSPGRNK